MINSLSAFPWLKLGITLGLIFLFALSAMLWLSTPELLNILIWHFVHIKIQGFHS